ncbi:hypothetical protein HPB50_005337 [Hyalomma asiaticum]|uniref:Uncharacterized protein n=1 Tax=Hyalomma asiaticum TaxID=266040 RepID=A0ACB7SMS3_HYAAI|nr:hypothetical protein HPB50_005337 [Hyalomma asiaticum]
MPTFQVSGGHVQYRFDCGSGEGLVRVNGRRVDDGAWHALHLERRGGSAQLTVDVHYEASGSAPGPHDVLNLEGRELHLGGAPAVAGLVGCLDNAQVGGQPLPLHLRPAGHAQLRRLANVHFSCHLVDDVCASQPCLNGATCRLTTAADYTCICSRHFQGPRCKEPVAEGQCTDVACAPANCQAKQCLHGGLCRPDGQCHCLAPYKLLGTEHVKVELRLMSCCQRVRLWSEEVHTYECIMQGSLLMAPSSVAASTSAMGGPCPWPCPSEGLLPPCSSSYYSWRLCAAAAPDTTVLPTTNAAAATP